ncbi:RNA transcription, translation and transport factor protein-like [Molossus nigricans]
MSVDEQLQAVQKHQDDGSCAMDGEQPVTVAPVIVDAWQIQNLMVEADRLPSQKKSQLDADCLLESHCNLTALDYHNPAGFNCKDETEFRNFIVWFEDQKIRHYKIEDRGHLRNIHSSDWPKFFEKCPTDVNYPFKIQDQQEAIDWLLGLAVRLEYGHNAEKYKADNTKNGDNAAKNAEPLINLDINNPDFKVGIMTLANLLQIQLHGDYLVMLQAICILAQEHLTQEEIAKASQAKEGLPVALDKHILGFDTGDAVLNETAQILRLLHIEELRDLQTKNNEAIVAVLAIIADPKTDHRLEKVGR